MSLAGWYGLMSNKRKEVDLDTEAGYLNVPGLFEVSTIFNFIVGGRGIGKTYGFLKYLIENKILFLYLRRTQKQTDIINKPQYSPVKPVMRDMGQPYDQAMNAGGSAVITSGDDVLGYTAALSTFASLRSFDMSDVKVIIYDEFIPEPTERATIKNEYEGFLNMYETVNRNRELQGIEPVKLFALANANKLDNALFMGLELISVSDKMLKRKKESYHDMKRSISVYYPQRSPISAKKAKTALYNLAGETGDFSQMAIGNQYAVDQSDIKNRPLIEYKPVVNLGEICIYRHKSDSKRYYTTSVTAKGSAPAYPATERGIEQFKERHGRLLLAFFYGDQFEYASLFAKTLLRAYLT